MCASTSLVMTSTMTDTPTPALPVVSAERAGDVRDLGVVARDDARATGRSPLAVVIWLTCAPSAMNAFVVMKKTSTMNEPPTAASPLPAPPATVTEVTDGRVILVMAGSGTSDVSEDGRRDGDAR